MSSILGRESATTFFYAIQVRYNLRDGELEKNPLKAIEGLNSILGRPGYLILEPAIISEIRSRFGISNRKAVDLDSILEESKNLFLRS